MEYEDKIELENGHCLVLIDVAGNVSVPVEEANTNIVCLGKDMNIIWRISAPEGMHERDSFVELNKEKDGTITARRFFGNTYNIDPNTGNAEQTGWEK